MSTKIENILEKFADALGYFDDSYYLKYRMIRKGMYALGYRKHIKNKKTNFIMITLNGDTYLHWPGFGDKDVLIDSSGNIVEDYGGPAHMIRKKVSLNGIDYLCVQKERSSQLQLVAKDSAILCVWGEYNPLDKDSRHVKMLEKMAKIGLTSQYAQTDLWLHDLAINNQIEEQRLLFDKLESTLLSLYSQHQSDPIKQKETIGSYLEELVAYVNKNPKKFMEEMGCLR